MPEIRKHRVDPDMSEAALNRRIRRLADLHDLAFSLKKAVPMQPHPGSPPSLVREGPASPLGHPVNPV